MRAPSRPLQVAGQFFDLVTSGLRDGVMPQAQSSAYSTSLVNLPFKIAVSRGSGVLYFADLMNSAVRRVLVKTACVCPIGSVLLPSASSCYNPSSAAVPLCTEPFVYALPGDVTCFRSCADALAQGLSPPQCSGSLLKRPQLFNTYAQLLGQLKPPQNTLLSDWYGAGPSLAWNAFFDEASTYRQGSMPGHAPFSNGDFVSLTFLPSGQCWAVETQYRLRPQLILPGVWYACGDPILASQDRGCSCPGNLLALERTPTNPTEEALAAAAAPRWQALRNAAVVGHSMGITQSTVFMVMGTDQSAPTACPFRAEGPCFPVYQQHNGSEGGQSVWLENSDKLRTAWAQDGIQHAQCRVGWPAVYSCPNGYAWTALYDQPACSVPVLPALAACLSCLPGTFSSAPQQQKQTLGGPYSCLPCEQGFFAEGVGSAACLPCPANTYATAAGSTACTACPPGKYTPLPAAYTPRQCANCAPGTGSCVQCVPGAYQVLGGQTYCEIVPAGFFSSGSDLTSAPVPCPAGTFQNMEGRSTCTACPQAYTSAPTATVCTACAADNACTLSLGNVCGSGCGLNRYFDHPTQTCVTCAAGKLNAQAPCATDPNVCWENPRRDFYLLADGTIGRCEPGLQATRDFLSCMPCLAGLYSDTGSGGCAQCPQGQYSNTPGTTACSLCPAGSSNGARGSQTCTVCEPGTYSPAPAGLCLPCPPGLVSTTFAALKCAPCSSPDQIAPAGGMGACNTTCNASLGFYAVSGDTVCRSFFS